ncbi:huntingtin-interacting protein 1 isoform X2 [Drosophila subobscura]|uniref:huntingtin-interacting protein 1 isoform X2 n=1 Tax=Drosophila subobscura TaxID=7241 RepID=UPI00155A1531|nr:huntingtin-interacting protein 1 isoform X2 [Drosophila subobscura]
MSTLAEKDFYQLTVSTNKALNGIEAPLKTKHARSIIIMIHKTKEAKSFWNTISRQSLMQSRFTAWKFCHLLHKVLREGHPCAIKHSQSHRKMILEVGKMWGLLQDDIGLCINAYCKLLVTKLNFHEKNPFPGTLIVSFKELAKAADRDLNYFFQLCVEIFDYLEDIIALQLQIFASINTYRMSSMTQQGQCRLAPMICLIQDSNALYDNSVRIMFKLHENLPNDVLSGHRDRFNVLFLKLKDFYENVRPLQYFKSLISVPELPASSPNFSSQVDFSSYIPPVVYVQPEPEPVVEDLVETSSPSEPDYSQTQQQLNTLESIINEKDATIEELRFRLNSLQQNFDELGQSYQREVTEMQKTNALLSSDLLISREMCENIRMQNDDLEAQLNQNPMLIQKVMEEEEKQKQSSEKFNKLKTLYTQIRDEHIKLLREQSESTKVLNKEKQTNSELLLQTKVLNNEILKIKGDVEEKNKINFDLLQQIEDQKEQLSQLESVRNEIKEQFENVVKQKEIQELDSISTSERLSENSVVIEKLNETLKEAQEKVSLAENQIVQKNEELQQHLKAHETEKETLLALNEQLKLEHKTTFEAQKKELQQTTNSLNQKETSLQETTGALALLKQEQLAVTQQYEDLQGKHAALEENFLQTTKQVDSITESYQNCHSNLKDVRKLVVQTVKDICSSKLSDSAEQPLDAIPKITTEMDGLIVRFTSTPELQKATSIEGLQAAMYFGYTFIKLYDQCDVIYKSTTEIETGQDILMKASSICSDIGTFFQYSLNEEPRERESQKALSDAQSKLSDIRKLVDKIKQTFEQKMDFDKLLEIELREMDSAIDEAASKIINLLAKAREKDDKTNLEVNGKIVDACTTLMQCVKVLILKSRVLQQEIVASQKGNASANEFYKRNSQWSDGLISASKSVAKAANYLVEAANNAIESESGKNFELIVAAQEIAACTAQMVIASKVKANRNSQNLTDLTKASRSVTQATGTLVATVKDCNSQLEELNEKELSNLTPSQIKTMEMEIHVKVLETEQALQTQRMKLSAFRREHYKNTDY